MVPELHREEKVDESEVDVGFRETLPPITSRGVFEPPNLERKWLRIRLVR